MTDNVASLSGSMEKIERISSEVTGAIEEVTIGAEEIEKVMSNVFDLITELNRSSEELENEAGQFSV